MKKCVVDRIVFDSENSIDKFLIKKDVEMRIMDKLLKGVVILTMMAFIGFGISCAPPPQPTYRHYPALVQHNYALTVVSVDGDPIEGARIKYKLYDHKALFKENTFITTSDGKLSEHIRAVSDSTFQSVKSFETKFDYEVSKDGYYSISGSMSSRAERYENPQNKEIILIKPVDYFSTSFLHQEIGTTLKANILDFIDLIRLHSLEGGSYLEMRSIDLVSFKNRKYLQFKFNTVTVFNSLKMNKYDIGKRLFDEIIRKVLSPLNQHISDPRIFFGYDLNITGYTKSFADEYASTQSIKYRFLMSDETVKKYKNKDISGQQVLDNSIILMDDERIELKLQ